MNLDRRRLVVSAAGLAVGGMATARLLPEEMLLRDRRPQRSRVAVISAEEYSEHLDEVLLSGLREFRLNLRGKSVLLKPNFVEYIAGVEVNTNPVVVGAAAEAFLKLGAKSVVVGEGPGHQRDTHLVLAESGLPGGTEPAFRSPMPCRAPAMNGRPTSSSARPPAVPT